MFTSCLILSCSYCPLRSLEGLTFLDYNHHHHYHSTPLDIRERKSKKIDALCDICSESLSHCRQVREGECKGGHSAKSRFPLDTHIDKPTPHLSQYFTSKPSFQLHVYLWAHCMMTFPIHYLQCFLLSGCDR